MTDAVVSQDEQYESEHVHEVYEQIASHFSATRYKPWPIVERFLKELPDGSVGLDVGCGNGKYLAVNPNVFMVGSDRSGPARLCFIQAQLTLQQLTQSRGDCLKTSASCSCCCGHPRYAACGQHC